MKSDTPPHQSRHSLLCLLSTITVILVGWALHATGAFMVPVVFSVFLALLVAPLDRMVSNRVPDKVSWLGHAVAIGALFVALLVFVAMIWIAAQQVVSRFPSTNGTVSLLPQFGQEMRDQPNAVAKGAAGTPITDPQAASGSSAYEGLTQEVGDLFPDAAGALVEQLGSWASSIAVQILSTASSALFATVLVIFLTLIMLIEAPRWRQKLACVTAGRTRRDVIESAAVISTLLRRYLVARTVIGVVTALLYVTWLWLFGVDLLLVWALLTFVLNYIPTLGSLISGALPVLYAVMQKDPGTAIIVGIGIFAIEQVMGNYIDPRVQGRQVSLSSLVVLITLLVWGWIWGIAGAILAVPMTIAAMIICAHIDHLRPFALMLSDETDLEGLDRQASGAIG
ncbi:AI-2E family transporter [Paracoccus liaowanqingii]|uniref:AI-2E family transporter n=1 Tax=Paracoccus liaowanqingii TaxID=2560053 RepID=A0A4Z1CB85_9RHOB|nr:AI-2E family transporter [Paracoccus liaowanqingii]TGN61822.1 AI-2E family transporter [Paracoccus liaowanqingii]